VLAVDASVPVADRPSREAISMKRRRKIGH
jgi:hypothetical protein